MSQAKAALFSRAAVGGRDDWRTPERVIRCLEKLGPVGLDPCGAPGSLVPAAQEWRGPKDSDQDGLLRAWADQGVVFVNPPYSESDAWCAKMAEEAAAGVEIVGLLASRTDTRRWHDHVLPYAPAICYVRGRLTFVGAPAPAPFPSALPYYGARIHDFAEAFREIGTVQFGTEVDRVRRWEFSIPHTVPTGLWWERAKPEARDAVVHLLAEDLRAAKARLGIPKAHGPRRLRVKRIAARVLEPGNLRDGHRPLMVALQELGLVRVGTRISKVEQGIDRQSQRTVITLEEAT